MTTRAPAVLKIFSGTIVFFAVSLHIDQWIFKRIAIQTDLFLLSSSWQIRPLGLSFKDFIFILFTSFFFRDQATIVATSAIKQVLNEVWNTANFKRALFGIICNYNWISAESEFRALFVSGRVHFCKCGNTRQRKASFETANYNQGQVLNDLEVQHWAPVVAILKLHASFG